MVLPPRPMAWSQTADENRPLGGASLAGNGRRRRRRAVIFGVARHLRTIGIVALIEMRRRRLRGGAPG